MRPTSLVSLLALAAAAIGAAPLTSQPTLAPASRLWIEGKSTVRSWNCKATALDARLGAQEALPVGAVLEGTKAIATVALTVPVAKLDCANGTMNEHMRKALNAGQHDAIAFVLQGYEIAKGEGVTGILQGALTINGVERPVTLPVEFAAAPGGALTVKGSYPLDMTQWSVKPPRLFMGTLKVNPLVTVHFDLLLR